MNGLENAVVAEGQDTLATITREGNRLPANAFLAWELVLFSFLVACVLYPSFLFLFQRNFSATFLVEACRLLFHTIFVMFTWLKLVRLKLTGREVHMYVFLFAFFNCRLN